MPLADDHAQVSAAEWRSVLDNAADLVLVLDEDGTVESAGGRLHAAAGRALPGRSVFSIAHPADAAALRRAWDALAPSAPRHSLVLRAPAVPPGEDRWRWVSVTLVALPAVTGVRRVVALVADAHHSQLDRQARREHERRYRSRFEQSAVAQSICDRTGVVVEVNDALCRMLGVPRGLLLGRQPRSVLHARDSGAADAVLDEVLAGHRDHARLERVLAGPGGRALPVLCDVTLLRDEDGRPDGLACSWQDLTALRAAERRRRQQEEFFLAVSRSASELSVVMDGGGRLLYVSPSAQRLLGRSAEDLVVSGGTDLVHPDDLVTAQGALEAALRDGTSTVTWRARTASGAWLVLEETLTDLTDTAVGGVVGNLRDITARVEAEAALRRSEARYRAIADTASEGIAVFGRDDRVSYANRRLCEILHLPLDRVLGSGVRALLQVDEDTDLTPRDPGSPASRHEGVHRTDQGRDLVLSIACAALVDGESEDPAWLVMVSDVTAAKTLERDLEHAVLHDRLTGLPNRVLLTDRLRQAAARSAGTTAVLVLDVDHFTGLNERYGHAVGDRVLQQVGRRLQGAVAPGDTVARVAGDEFVVVCEDAAGRAVATAEALLLALVAPVEVDGLSVPVVASVGVALTTDDDQDHVLQDASAALRAAKQAGRGRVQLYEASAAGSELSRRTLAADLEAALRAGALELHYQPVVDLEDGRVLGVEALARWHHPERGQVSPVDFVAVAEAYGLWRELDVWALERALQDAHTLTGSGVLPADAYVAVNVCPQHLSHPGFEPAVVQASVRSGVPVSRLVLEITENALMDDLAAAQQVLQRLRDRGCGVAVDDFGMGLSSLSYLRDLPITVLKVDRSFVTPIHEDKDAYAIAAFIVELGATVGLTVVAEGVETATHAALLRDMGSRAGQGWLWSRARSVPDLLATGWGPRFEVPEPSTHGRPVAPRPCPGLDPAAARLLVELQQQGASPGSIAAALNTRGLRTPDGTWWHRASVARALLDVQR